MKNKNKMLLLGVLSLTFSLFAFNTASAKYNWADYFSRDEAKSIKKMTRKSVKNKLKKPGKSWKNILSGKVLKDGAISGDKIENGTITIDKIANKVFKYSNLDLTGSIKASDIASNGCSSGQILKYNGSAWTCGSDDNTGSTLGNTVESSEITDGTIVNADINSSAGIEYSKLNLGANISSGNITDGTIVNADIDATAAIDYSKLNLGTNISSTNITNDTIVNADVNTAAAIDYSKLNLTGSILSSDLASSGCVANQILKYNGTNWVCGADENSGGALGNSIESSEITDGTIVNADINASASIDSDKINFLDKNIDVYSGTINLKQQNSSGNGEIRFNEDPGSSEYSYIRKHGPSGYLQIGSTDDDPIAISETVFIGSGKNLYVGGDINLSDPSRDIIFNDGDDGVISGGYLFPSHTSVITINDALKLEPISDITDTCDSSTEGIIYYSSIAHALKLCNGTAWVTVTAL